eukprot:gene9802-20391_t
MQPYSDLFLYEPNSLDDPDMLQGKHRSLRHGAANTGPVVSSIISFVNDHDLRQSLNEQFREKHPLLPPSLTLSKIRNLKKSALLGCLAVDIELSTVALAGVVSKVNRHLTMAVTLLLAYKFNQPLQLMNANANKSRLDGMLEFFDREWSLSKKEFGAFVLLGFNLHAPHTHVFVVFTRLLKLAHKTARVYMGDDVHDAYWQSVMWLDAEKEEEERHREQLRSRADTQTTTSTSAVGRESEKDKDRDRDRVKAKDKEKEKGATSCTTVPTPTTIRGTRHKSSEWESNGVVAAVAPTAVSVDMSPDIEKGSGGDLTMDLDRSENTPTVPTGKVNMPLLPRGMGAQLTQQLYRPLPQLGIMAMGFRQRPVNDQGGSYSPSSSTKGLETTDNASSMSLSVSQHTGDGTGTGTGTVVGTGTGVLSSLSTKSLSPNATDNV